MLLSIVWAFVASNVRLQTLQGVFPMRLRWNFHRLMLGQSLGFYQDEFAGRVSAKVMQTALAVRDTVMTCTDMLVYVAVYLITLGVILVAHRRLAAAAVCAVVGVVCGTMRAMHSALGQNRAAPSRCPQPDDRPHHRRLFQHHHREAFFARLAREAAYAKASMRELMQTVHGADAPGHGARLASHVLERVAHRGHRRAGLVAVEPRPGGRWRSGHRHRHGFAAQQHVAMDYVGSRRACLNTSAPCKTA